MSRAVLTRVLGVVCLFALAACAREPASRSHPLALEAGVPIDNELMAYLSMARARHHQANLEEDDNLPTAIASLEKLTMAPRPHPQEKIPEIEEVLADTFARLAELELRIPDVTAATEGVRQGLLHATEPSYFRGHLLEVGGLVEEAREASLRDAGSTAAASAARKKAFDLFQQAVNVQELVVQSSLRKDAASEGGSK